MIPPEKRIATQFKKGVSANPGGRPKGFQELRELAQTHTLEAVKTLATIMKNAKVAASSRVNAATVLLERGWGKPVQTVEVKRTPFDDLSPDELRAIGEAIETLSTEEGGAGGGNQDNAGLGKAVGISTLQ